VTRDPEPVADLSNVGEGGLEIGDLSEMYRSLAQKLGYRFKEEAGYHWDQFTADGGSTSRASSWSRSSTRAPIGPTADGPERRDGGLDAARYRIHALVREYFEQES